MVARATGQSVGEAARAFFGVGALTGLDWLRAAAENAPPEGHWERLAVNAMIDDFYGQQRVLTVQALDQAKVLGAAADALAHWRDSHAQGVRRTVSLIDEMRSGAISVAKLAFVNRQIRDLMNK